ncbi:glycosyltransferase family 2 protein [Paenibacillus apiarius]|uniref:glycosyltransferase family 2 protein n=1 Tax=Paenibacillus apiarius TaxID=46240 RepID=UPI00197DB0F3|nr:glycosyltransferase family 2 protein [Paenibacillus apiarius]MBN3525569.1 glycosyltransferase [Paenibacillus apiarius]
MKQMKRKAAGRVHGFSHKRSPAKRMIKTARRFNSTRSWRGHIKMKRSGGRRLSNTRRRFARAYRDTRPYPHQSSGQTAADHRVVIPAEWLRAAAEAGQTDGREYAGACGTPSCARRAEIIRRMQTHFTHFAERNLPNALAYFQIKELAAAYRKGFAVPFFPQANDAVLLPTTRTMGAVLTACNEENSIATVMKELSRLPLDETIVIVNGSTDNTLHAVRQSSDEATVVHYPEALGHDVGRSIGAKLSRADIVLFVDGDFSIPAEEMGAFVWSVHNGVDVALNDIGPFLHNFDKQDGITHCKQWLNRCLGRDDLYANSMTAIPHALSRKALDIIGIQALSVPPKAQALAIARGLHVRSVHAVDVINKNRVRATNIGSDNPVAELILGDHLEALRVLMDEGASMLRSDQQRERIALRRNSI